MLRRGRQVLLAAGLALLAAAGVFAYGWYGAGPLTKEQPFLVRSGSSLRSVAADLQRAGAIRNSGGSAAGVGDGFCDFRIHNIHDGRNQGSWREILAGAALLILAVFLQDLLIDGALHIAFHHVPVLFIHHVDDLFEHDRPVNLIGSPGKDGAHDAVLLG